MGRILYLHSHTISIHSLHTEGDARSSTVVSGSAPFQSTPSTRRETVRMGRGTWGAVISIHSLHTEGDSSVVHSFVTPPYFNPLPPHGGRHYSVFRVKCQGGAFQSTPSTRRETLGKRHRIHRHDFNPLPPHGGRPQNCTGKRFSFRLSLYNPAKKDAKDYILHPKK